MWIPQRRTDSWRQNITHFDFSTGLGVWIAACTFRFTPGDKFQHLLSGRIGEPQRLCPHSGILNISVQEGNNNYNNNKKLFNRYGRFLDP